MHRLKPYLPLILCMIVMAAFMATGKAALDTEREISDTRYQIQTEAIQSLVAALEEQSKQIAELSRTISKLQSEIDSMKFKPLDIGLATDLQEFTYYRSMEAGIDPNIIFALMWRESRFQTDAIGYNANGTQDYGLCQLNDVTLPFLSERGIDPTESPQENIRGTIELLSYFRYERGYTTLESLAAYGVGETGMLRGGGFVAAEKLLRDAEELGG